MVSTDHQVSNTCTLQFVKILPFLLINLRTRELIIWDRKLVMRDIQRLLIELDRLKSVYRNAFLSDRSRNENSAEHSWHLGIALLALREVMPLELNVDHAVRIALVHDICEIGAGDISVYDPDREQISNSERAYISQLVDKHQGFALDIQDLWCEYEEQRTLESRWVKVVDRLLPFLMNLATEGKTWRKLGITRDQVVEINSVIASEAPEIYRWMEKEIEKAVGLGWLASS